MSNLIFLLCPPGVFPCVQLAPSSQWCPESSHPVDISPGPGEAKGSPGQPSHTPACTSPLITPFPSSPSLFPGVTLPARVNKLTMAGRRQDMPGSCSHRCPAGGADLHLASPATVHSLQSPACRFSGRPHCGYDGLSLPALPST